jgi:hypothetical protein
MSNWTRTGNEHEEPCGCIHAQETHDNCDYEYHERWRCIAPCAEHEALGEPSVSEESIAPPVWKD